MRLRSEGGIVAAAMRRLGRIDRPRVLAASRPGLPLSTPWCDNPSSHARAGNYNGGGTSGCARPGCGGWRWRAGGRRAAHRIFITFNTPRFRSHTQAPATRGGRIQARVPRGGARVRNVY